MSSDESNTNTTTDIDSISTLNTSLTSLEKDKLANGLFNALKPTIEAIDGNIKNVYDSQSLLKGQLDRLEQVLTAFQDTPVLTPLHPYCNKLSVTRLRLGSLANDINKVNNRLETIRTLIRDNQAVNVVGQNGPVLKEDDMNLLNE